MKRIGLVGGLGPESTIDYYQRLIERYRELRGGGYPDLVIDSLDVDYARGLIERNDLAAFTDYHVASCERLAAAGAALAALGSNTSHLVYDVVAARSPIPLVSIVDAAREAAGALGLKRLALFGTNFTMEAEFYPAAFAAAGITIVVPAPGERARIHGIYYDELVRGKVLNASRDDLLAIAARMKAEDRAEGLILGGTELTLILKPEHAARAGLPLLDTAGIHVEAILERALA